jgi:hypothetical protein
VETTFIYILEDPRNSIPRYLGKSNNPINRLKAHIGEALNGKKFDHKNNWIRSLLKINLKPEIFILDEVPINEWQFWEKHYGHLFLSWGFDMVFDRDYLGIGSTDMELFNSRPKKKRVVSEAGRLKIKAAAQRRELNPSDAMKEMRKKFGARELGIPSCMKGKKMSSETRKKMSESHKGNKAPWFGKKQPEEMKQKNREKHTGKEASKKTKDKMSASQKKRWQIYRKKKKNDQN